MLFGKLIKCNRKILQLRKLKEELCRASQHVFPVCSLSAPHAVVIRNGSVAAEILDRISAAAIVQAILHMDSFSGITLIITGSVQVRILL